MEKIFNWLSMIGGTVGGFLISLLGGWDKLIMALLILMCLDYITGVIKAICNKELSSEIGFKRFSKEGSYFSCSFSCCDSRTTSWSSSRKRNSNYVFCSK